MHVNYGLRGDESDRDEAFCRSLCREHSIDIHVLNVKGQYEQRREKASLQVWARQIRRDFYLKFADKGFTIALAHQANDVAENALFRLARGSSFENIAGMSLYSPPIWRPFLDFSKEDLYTFLRRHHHLWREDLSNTDSEKYARNYIRLEILPRLEALFHGATLRIASSARSFQDYGSGEDDAISMEDHVAAFLKAMKLTHINRRKVKASLDLLKSSEKARTIRISNNLLFRSDAGLLSITEMPQTRQQKHSRLQQHLHALSFRPQAALLGMSCQLVISCPAVSTGDDKSGRLGIYAHPQPHSEVSLSLPKSHAKYFDRVTGKPFKFKELMQKWNIQVEKRVQFVELRVDDHPAELLDLATLMKSAQTSLGEKHG